MYLNYVEYVMLSFFVMEKYFLVILVFLLGSFESILKSCYCENLELFFFFNEVFKIV